MKKEIYKIIEEYIKSNLKAMSANNFKVGSRVKRIKGTDIRHANGSMHPAEAIGKVGTIKRISEEVPKKYWIDFDDHYQGTRHEGVLIGVIAEDLIAILSTPKSRYLPGQRIINTLNNKLGVIVRLRDDRHEMTYNWPYGRYNYSINYDDGSFETYEAESRLSTDLSL